MSAVTDTTQSQSQYTIHTGGPATVVVIPPADPMLSLYTRHRRELLRVWRLMPPALRTQGAAYLMEICGRDLWLRHYLADGHRELHRANFCRHRMCPMCQWIHSLQLYHQVAAAVATLAPAQRRKMYHVVLTLPSVPGPELRPTLRRLIDAEGAMARDLLRGRNGPRLINGRARSVEITKNEVTGLYHPHVHVIWAAVEDYAERGGPYLPQAELCSLWGRYVGHADPICWISQIKAAETTAAVAEVTKYMVKPGVIQTPEDYTAVYWATRGLRLWSTSGVLKTALAIAQAELADIDPGAEGRDWILEWFRWYNAAGGYVQQSPEEGPCPIPGS